MSGSSIKVDINTDELKKELEGVTDRFRNMKPAMKIIGEKVVSSIARNFEKGGRPTRWAKHSKTTEKRRGKGAAILRDEGHLMNSIHANAFSDRVIVGADNIAYAATHQFGAKKGQFGIAYAATHQFGAKKGQFGRIVARVGPYKRRTKAGRIVTVREHDRRMAVPWGDIPARPYVMIQDNDWTGIRRILADYIVKGEGAKG